MNGLRIALVTAYPPTRGRLSEYGWHLVDALRRNRRVGHVYVLADTAPGATSYSDDNVSVVRCWTFDRADLPLRVARGAGGHDVDVLWFNLHMTSTGTTRLSRFAGLAAPALLRRANRPTLVTLHNLLGLTDIAATGVRATRLDLLGAELAVSALGRASALCVLLPEYADLLRRGRRSTRVHVMPHGTLGSPSGELSSPAPPNTVLAFGRFGTYKRLEQAIAATHATAGTHNGWHLRIAGSDSIHAPGYLASLRARHAGARNVTFLDYVEEARVGSLFRQAALALLPYRTTTGASGVAMQAATHGTPILAADVPGLRLLERHGLAMSFYRPDDPHSLRAEARRLLDSPVIRREHAERNLELCGTMTMTRVVDEYVDLMETLVGAR